jgi:hypothetical protein
MATAASRSRALALYRKLLRSSQTWPGPDSEKKYILVSVKSRVSIQSCLINSLSYENLFLPISDTAGPKSREEIAVSRLYLSSHF